MIEVCALPTSSNEEVASVRSLVRSRKKAEELAAMLQELGFTVTSVVEDGRYILLFPETRLWNEDDGYPD